MSRSMPLRNRDAHEALSAALLGKKVSQQTNMVGTEKAYPADDARKAGAGSRNLVDEDEDKSNHPFKKLKTGKGWNVAVDDEREPSPPAEREPKPSPKGDSGREPAPSPPSRGALDGSQRSSPGDVEMQGAADVKSAGAKSKIQMLKNRMRQSSRSNIMSDESGLAEEQMRGSPKKGALKGGKPGSEAHKEPARKGTAPPKGKRGPKPKAESEDNEAPAPHAAGRPPTSPHLGGQHHSAFFSYQAASEGDPARRSITGASLKGMPNDAFQDPEGAERQLQRSGAALAAQTLQQRQVCWQGKVKHKLKDSMVELFHLAAAIPAELAEQFPPSLYVSELRHRGEVILSSHIWARCAARSLTEKQTSKLQLLSDNKLVAIIRLQHCELILVPDIDPASGAIRMAGFLMGSDIYGPGR